MFSLNDSMRYLLYNKPTDMRKSYHTLCGLVTNELGCAGTFGKPSGLAKDAVSGSIEWSELVMLVEGIIEQPDSRRQRLESLKKLRR